MKNRLNAFCVLIVLVFTLVVGYQLKDTFCSFIAGFNEGYSHSTSENMNHEKSSMSDLVSKSKLFVHPFEIVPSTGHIKYDKIKNAKLNRDDDYVLSVGMVFLDRGSIILQMSLMFLNLISYFFYVWSVVYFFRFIRNINRNIIFDKRNIIQLRKLGWGFVIVFFTTFIASYLDFYDMTKYFSLSYAEIKPYHPFASTEIFMGLTAFLFAEVFSIGIKMREEQELTI